jgi:hypothetical protein
MRRAAWSHIAALAITGWLATPAHAIDIETIDVRYENGLYKVRFIAELEAQPASVVKVLKDYDHYPSLDSRIEASHLIASPPGTPPRLYTKLKGCLSRIFCRSMVRIETLGESPGELTATAIPTLSDVQSSITRTEWQPSPKGTRISYSLALDPKFWVPALFARRAMIDTMRSGTVTMFTSVERVARNLPAAEGNGKG